MNPPIVPPFVALDTGVLGILTHPDPRRSPEASACLVWMQSLLQRGAVILLPEISDYEERRELVRRASGRSLEKLNALAGVCDYIPLSTSAMRRAADLWADLRRNGRVTADPKELDGDVILCAQVLEAVESRGFSFPDVVVATTNVGHLSWMLPAQQWRGIA